MCNVLDVSEGIQSSPLFRRDPKYRRFYKVWREMNLGIAGIFGEFLQMPLSRTFDLYELWCFLRVLRALCDQTTSPPPNLSALFTESDNRITIATGSVSVSVRPGVSLSFQRCYPEYWNSQDGIGSLSRPMIPDIVLKLGTIKDGEKTIIFDAKYRIDSGVSESMASLHMYRDALVQRNDLGQTNRFVDGAFILCPTDSRPLAQRNPQGRTEHFFESSYRRTHKLGAVSVRPGTPFLQIKETILSVIDEVVAA